MFYNTMFRLRSGISASLRVILAQVCATSYTRMYNNWSYTSIHAGDRNLRVKLLIPMSAKPTRWNHYIDIGHNRNKSINTNSADFCPRFISSRRISPWFAPWFEIGYFSNVNFRQRKDVVTSKTRLGLPFSSLHGIVYIMLPNFRSRTVSPFRDRVRTHATRSCSLRWFFEDNLLTFVRWFWKEESTIWTQCTGGDSLCFGTIGLHFYGSIWKTL